MSSSTDINIANTMSKCDDCGNIIFAGIDEILLCQPCRDKRDENLFIEPPQLEDCPICFLQIPHISTGSKYKSCCGKIVCSGCIIAVNKMDFEAKCPFCRVPAPESDEDIIERYKRRMEMDDAKAMYDLGCGYYNGELGLPQDHAKALELFHRAGELGCVAAFYNIGCAYDSGIGVEWDMKKAKHYWELAAMGGDVNARYNLGWLEEVAGNMSIALQHFMIAAGCGYNDSLKKIREFYVNGHATKDDYAKALRAHQKYVDGIKSAQRDEAAAFNNEKYRYY